MRTRTAFLMALLGCGTAVAGVGGTGPRASTTSASTTSASTTSASTTSASKAPGDYTAPTLARKQAELPALQARLAAIDPKAWPIAEQVDYRLVRAEMNGLYFD